MSSSNEPSGNQDTASLAPDDDANAADSSLTPATEANGKSKTPTAAAASAHKKPSASKPKRSPKSSGSNKKKPPPSSKNKKQSPPSNDTKTPAQSNSDKKSKASTPAKKKPTMTEMCHHAILSLGDRTGSSSIAIAKFVLENYDHVEESKSFRSRLNLALKSAVKNERFKKIRNSYKIEPAYAKKERERKKKQSKKMSEAERKKQRQEEERIQQEKNRELEAKMSPAELAVHRKEQAKQRELQRKRELAEQQAKERQERIRKRRFPMEDTKLHKEDAELHVKPPAHVTRRPALPYFFHATLPLDDAKRQGKTPSSILTPSKCDLLEYGSRGLVPDLLQVYHFFRGDVHFTLSEDDTGPPLVPEFRLDHLMFAVEQVLNGNAKRSKLLPPLIVHLFCTCLKLLTMNKEEPVEGETVHEARLRKDLAKLAGALSPSSWSEVCALYMDAMERYYTSSASVDPIVLPSGKIDVQYLMRATDVAEPMTPAVTNSSKRGDNDMEVDAVAPLPDGYCGYLGNPHGTLATAQAKLIKQDSWNLKADEVMALLRALTDDVLATNPTIADDLARRDEEMWELLKAKRNADSHFRKIKLQYEGPKNPSRSKAAAEKKESEPTESKESEEKPSSGKKGSKENRENTGDAQEEKAPKFKPTATKKQFDSAAKAQQKAHDAYNKGLRTLTARTEPVGYDRNHNAVYFFNHDPERLYVEISKPAAEDNRLPPDMRMKKYSWHVIETKSLFDAYTSSLDVRGKRESNLYDELVGPAGGHFSLKRGLYDDLKEQSDKTSRLRQREDLDRRLANARIACQAEEDGSGRRSGRLQSQAQIDLAEIEEEIEALENQMAAEDAPPEAPDYDELTGLDILIKFDKASDRRETRRSRERKEASSTTALPSMPCTKLIPTGDIDGTGLVGLVVSKLLELEETCEALSPWERTDVSRSRWIADLEERVHDWGSSAQLVVGPTPGHSAGNGRDSFGTPGSKSRRSLPDSASSTDSKRRKLDSGSPASTGSSSNSSPAQILSLLKAPLLDLEERVFQITGLAMATQDADEADDNMSASSEDRRSRQEQKQKLAWKKKIHTLRSIETRAHVQIREVVVEAITAARKAHFGSIVTKLRSALLLYQPHAAGECKNAALAVLDSHGGYHEEDFEESDDESKTEEDMAEEEEDVPSALSTEAMALTGNLAGDDDADRVDWIDAVKNCKTIARWAALASSFLSNATELLEKTSAESDRLLKSLKRWEKEEDRKARSRAGKAKASTKKDESVDATEVWANVRYTNEFCMAKTGDSPYWPAKKCQAKDKELATSLNNAGRTLVSLIGEDGGLRAVRFEDIKPFDGNVIEEEDLEQASKSMRSQLDECMVVARRIVRGRKPSSAGGYQEEKKVAM